MTATTAMSMPLSKRVLATLATLAFAFCLALAMGVAPAYADNGGASAAGGNASDSAAGYAADLAASATGEGDPAPDAPATSPNNGNGLMASGDLEATGAYSRPVDNGSTYVFASLVPISTDSYDIGKVETSTNPDTNAITVELTGEVGMGVNLGVAVDYMRVGSNAYSSQAGSANLVELPDGMTPTSTSTFPKNGIMYTWYRNGIAPLGQGVYYTDPSTNPALYSTGAGSIPETSAFEQYNEKLENFLLDNDAVHGNTWPDRYVSTVPFPVHSTDPFRGIDLPLEDEIGAYDSNMYMTSPLFFETAGERTIVAQFTCIQEYRSTIGATENVGYVLYASNPVYFHIAIADKPVVALNIIAEDVTTGTPIDVSSNFEVELDKDYFNGYKSLGSDEDYGDLSFSSLINRRVSQTSYPYMAPGLYRLKVRHAEGLYQEYEEYFEVTEAQASSGAAITKIVRLKAVTPEKYTITFYDEDGITVLRYGRQYNAGTVASSIDAPDKPTKASTDKIMYVFKQWRAEVVGEGELDHTALVYDHLYPVTCDTNYIAEYREVLLKNDAGQSIVYATGNLFSEDAKPAGVLAYGLTSAPLTETEMSGIVASHSEMMSSESVLGMIQVDLTQYNDDKKKTTTNVTEHEGLNGMKLKFNMQESGINVSDGDKLKILQIHKKDDASPEEIIEHRATVVNGEAEITLNGKLSTFVFLMGDDDDPDSGDTPSGPGSGESGSASGGSGATEPEGGESGESGSGTSGGTADGSGGAQGGASGSHGESGSSDGSGSGGSQASANEPAGETEGNAPSGAPSASEAAEEHATRSIKGATGGSAAMEAEEGAQAPEEPVKAAPTPAEGALPVTGDSLGLTTLMLAALTVMAAVATACIGIARRRRRD